MRRQLFIKSAILLGWVCASVSAATAPAKKSILDIQYWKTSQGTPVYFVHTPELPMIDTRIIFTAGSAYDDKQWGIASLVTSMLDEGTKSHNADQIADVFDQVGAEFSNQTDRDVTTLSLRSLSDPKYFTSALQMFTEVLGQANFPQQAFSRVKQQTLSAINQEQQNPFSVATNAFYQNLYDDNAYSHTTLGTAQTINALTQDQARAFYQRYFVSANAKIILVGDLDRPHAEKIAEQLMAALPKGTPAPALNIGNKNPGTGMRPIEFPSQQTTIITGQLGIDRQNPEYFPLMVGNYLLGVMPLGSLLFEQVRNQHGLAYDVSSSFSLMTYRGPFVIVLQTRTAEKNQALNIAQQVLRQYTAEGPKPEQLQMAKQNIVNHFPLNLATNEQIGSVLAQMAINQRPLDYLDTYQDKVNAVSATQIKQAFQTYINPDKLLTVTVGQK